jgi:hypothetical protein
MKKSKWIGIALGALMLAPVGIKFASAATPSLNGFVCTTTWYPKKVNSTFGNLGAISGSIYTQPYCAGSFLGTYTIFGAGQTADPLANGFSEAQLSAMFQSLQRHISSGLKVQMQGFDTNSVGMSLITFSAQYQ